MTEAFLQWKGTDACFDFHCECGESCHFDGYFAYHVKCPYCKTVWKMPNTLQPTKVTKADGCVVEPEKDNEGE